MGRAPHITAMKRRNFLNLTAGSALAAAVPLPSAAAPAKAAATNGKYIWAVAMAKAQNRASPELLQASLKVSAAEAEALMARMSAQGVITAPNPAGLARATKPLAYAPSAMSPTTGTVVKATDKLNGATGKDLRRAVELLKTEEPEDSAPETTSPSDDDSGPPEASAAAHSAE